MLVQVVKINNKYLQHYLSLILKKYWLICKIQIKVINYVNLFRIKKTTLMLLAELLYENIGLQRKFC